MLMEQIVNEFARGQRIAAASNTTAITRIMSCGGDLHHVLTVIEEANDSDFAEEFSPSEVDAIHAAMRREEVARYLAERGE